MCEFCDNSLVFPLDNATVTKLATTPHSKTRAELATALDKVILAKAQQDGIDYDAALDALLAEDDIIRQAARWLYRR